MGERFLPDPVRLTPGGTRGAPFGCRRFVELERVTDVDYNVTQGLNGDNFGWRS